MANRLDFFLGRSEGATLLRDAERSLRIERILRKSLPKAISAYCSAGRLSQGRLVIYADNGAVALKLRQLSTSLPEKLKHDAPEIDSIRISVRVNPETRLEKKPKQGMGKKGVESFRELSDSLEDSPLKSSIESLLEKLGKR